jgi:hypothetical protein
MLDGRYGSISELGARSRHVRFPSDSDRTADIASGPVRGNGLMHRSKLRRYSCGQLHRYLAGGLAVNGFPD